MSVSNEVVRSLYTGNGVTTTFAIGHAIVSSSALEVEVYLVVTATGVETLQTNGSDYTISGSNVVFTTAPASTRTIVIQRKIALTQPTDLTTNAAFPAETVETSLDRVVAEVQLLNHKLKRAIKSRLSIPDAQLDMTLPDPVSGSYLRWNSDEDGLENAVVATATGALTLPGSSTADAIALWNGTGANALKDSLAAIDSSGVLSTPVVIETAKSAQTATYAVLAADHLIYLSSSAFTATLPTAVGRTGKRYRFVHTGSQFVVYTIATTSSQTINGVTTTTLNTLYEELEVISDGANWTARRYIPSDWTAFTPTGSWSANTTYTGWYKRNGASLLMRINLALAGAPTAAALTVTLPGSLEVNTSALSTTDPTGVEFGRCSILDSGTERYAGPVTYSSTTAVAVYSNLGSYAAVTAVSDTSPMTFANNDRIHMLIEVPISGWKG